MNNSEIMYKKKICMIGSFGVGKTSLVKRFVHDIFDDRYLTTIGVKVTQKKCPPVQTPDKKYIQCDLLLWDIEGAEQLRSATVNYYTGSSGALLVSDLTRKETIEAYSQLVEIFIKTNPRAKIILAGNKSDLMHDVSQASEPLKKFADKNRFPYFLTSAKTGQNVESAFFKFIELFFLKRS